jgi:acetyl esterase
LNALDDLGRSAEVAPAAAPLDWAGDDLAALRRAYNAMRPGRLRAGDRWRVVTAVPVLKALVHRPRHARPDSDRIVYFHGGGWYLGTPLTHAEITRALSEAAGLETWSLDYRLLPGPAPDAPLRDGAALCRRLLARNPAARLVLAGDSAGAALALAVAQVLETAAPGRLGGVVAFYGGYGLTDSASIAAEGRAEEGLDRETLAVLYRRLAGPGGGHRFTVERLARGRRRPTALFVGARDPLLDDSRALQVALARAGSPVTLELVPEVGHSFLHEVATSAAARATLRRAAAAIRRWR